MNQLKMMRLYIGLSLICVLVMGQLANWMNPSDAAMDIVEVTVLTIGALLLAATFFSKKVQSNPEPLLFGYLWFISAAAFVSLLQNQYDSMLLITILMMYFVVSQTISSLRRLQIYMVLILLELILFFFFTGDIKKTSFALVIFLTASIVIYLSTGKRLQIIREYEVTEQALRETVAEKNLYERAMHDVGTGVIIAEALAHTPVIYTNEAFSQITGYSADEVLGRNCNFLQGKDTKEEHIEQIRSALHQQNRIQLEILNYRKNHEPFWNELSITPLRDETGTVTHFIGIQTDVTVRKQLMLSEQQSRTMLEQVMRYLKDPVLVMRVEQFNLHPVMMNDAARELYESLDRTDVAKLLAYQEQILASLYGHETVEREMELTIAGDIRAYRVSISKLEDMVMLTFTDITSHRESERQLLLNKEALEHTNRAKDQFLAMISHEFRTPLNAILGIVQLQEQGHLPSEELLTLKHSSEHLLFLVERVLDYSAMENGAVHIDQRPFNLQELIVDLSAKYEEKLGKKGLEFRLTADQLPNVPVIGDARRTAQIIQTLLDNAVKFTPFGVVELSAHVRPMLDPAKLLLMIKVKDTGIGISEEAGDDIFKPFFQSDLSSTRTYGGLGIGLAFSHKLTELLGGRLSYQSKKGEGTVFTVELPFNLLSADHSEIEFAGKPRLLLAEDNIDNQHLFIAFVKKIGCRVDVAVNGLEAVRMFTEGYYHMVFMDIQMPVMDGYEATRQIRQWERQEGLKPAAIVALTAHAFAEHRQASTEAGCDDFLEKPVFMQPLFETIRRYGYAEFSESGG
ncbi:PAS domain-containing protein [Paenibacillus sp. P46E]|uniref:PAS domain-containing protein n=1 Tax=Paenibacillus sp. P46E TaxID=1349436 RepID=UPI0015B837C7|nr:PAS domain-containing protein [Paenibacillus sp. P46E]